MVVLHDCRYRLVDDENPNLRLFLDELMNDNANEQCSESGSVSGDVPTYEEILKRNSI